MKQLNNISVLLFSGILLLASACTKKDKIPGTASLNLFNAVAGSDTLVVSFNSGQPIEWFKTANLVMYGKNGNIYDLAMNNKFNAYSGTQQLAMFEYPDTLAHHSPVFNLTIDLPAGTIYSLFLTGTLAAPDTLFTRDSPPYHRSADSSMGIRFVNLVPGSMNVRVNLLGQPNGSEVSSLAYKGITAFKHYEVKKGLDEYIFEFRDATTNNLLATHRIDVRNQLYGTSMQNLFRDKNYTLAFYGVPGSSGPDQLAVQILDNN